MRIYDFEEAFAAWDITTKPMREAMERWEALYYEKKADDQSDPCQRIAYTVVNKIVRTMFGEYTASSSDPAAAKILENLNRICREAMQMTLAGGECYLKPCIEKDTFSFVMIPRSNMLVFHRDSRGNPSDIGTMEKTAYGKSYYTLLERRTMDEQGYLTIRNTLYRSADSSRLGQQVPLTEHPRYEYLEPEYRFRKPVDSVGLVRLKTPILNCVDGSHDGVAVFAAAEGLIKNIDRNEAQLNGEFSRGESRIIASSDLLTQKGLQDHLFVGLDEDPEEVGITIFSPALREESFLARKREYLRNVESIIGLKRGMLSDANAEKWTATEISSSAGEYNLTILDFQSVWDQGVRNALSLCAKLGELYHIPVEQDHRLVIDWGNGMLYDEDKTWQDYLTMVEKGLLRPEIALGWRFHMPFETTEERQKIRQVLMPDSDADESVQ